MATIPFPDLLGAGYLPLSRKAECQKAINVRRERVESDEGVGKFSLYKAPGLTAASQPNAAKFVHRGSYELNGHLFQVIDDTVYDLTVGYVINATYGPIANDGLPVKMAASQTTLMLLSAGNLYRISGGALTVPAVPVPFNDIDFLDNYFIGLAQGTSGSFYFNTDDGVTWPGGNVQTAEASANQWLALIVHQEILFIYGNKIHEAFVVGTDPNAPFIPQTTAAQPYGLVAQNAHVLIGLYRYWLNADKDGQGIVYRAQGYSVTRISDNALENAIRGYARDFGITDAIMMTFKQNGQEYVQLTFPAADVSWRLNASIAEVTGKAEWSQVLWWDFKLGQYHRHRANTICAAFGVIVVGDYANGWLYEMSPDEYTDFGFPMRWERQCPHILQDNKNVSYDRLELGAETGVGLAVPLWLNNYSLDPATFAANLAALVPGTITQAQANVLQAIYDGTPYTPLNPYPDPTVLVPLGFFPWGATITYNNAPLGDPPYVRMKYSDDGAKSFHQELARSLGQSGEDKVVAWDRLGAGRDRVYNLNGDGPYKLCITTAWIDAEAMLS